jgi:molybdopterin synthase catalytic subunit
VREKFGVLDVRVAHRVGSLAVGETAVWIGVTAAHRAAAFAGCRYVIDELKTRVPIWKKEFYTGDQPRWIGA